MALVLAVHFAGMHLSHVSIWKAMIHALKLSCDIAQREPFLNPAQSAPLLRTTPHYCPGLGIFLNVYMSPPLRSLQGQGPCFNHIGNPSIRPAQDIVHM